MADRKAPEWLALQRKIFSRWVSQKLWMSKHIKVNDIVSDLQADPTILIRLVEVLTEKPFTGKTDKVTKMRVQLISVANQVLKFIYDSGVQMKMKTSAEDLIDGDEKNVLALVFSILLKFMRIGDDEGGQQLSAKDALLMWVQNKTAGYPGCDVKNFGSSFHSGLPLCALIHKFRPQLLDYSALDKSNKVACIQASFLAAERYFGLEQYITPADFLKLDENGMMIFVSEFFYGISEQRKIDQAARRIHKVIRFTKTCDAMRAEFKDQSTKFKERLAKVEQVLGDRTIDDTMAGAKRKLEEFYRYKTEDKNVILGYQLNLESLFNNLAMLLAQNKRPEFVPPPGLSLKDIEAAMLHLEQAEQERKVALHAELNRQIKLVKLDEHHKSLHAKLAAYAEKCNAMLQQVDQGVHSIGAAQYAIKTLDAFDAESAGVRASTLAALLTLGAELVEERYERKAEVQQRECEINAAFMTLQKMSANKRPICLDHLAREQFREELRLKGVQHGDRYNRLAAWISEKAAYLAVHEEIGCISDAQVNLRLLDAFDADFADMHPSSVVPLKKLGQEILTAKYETQYSKWVYPAPEEIQGHEADVDSKWVELAQASKVKREYLDDSLAREQFREELRLKGVQHGDRYNRLAAWIGEKAAYLAVHEEIGCISDAQSNLRLLDACDAERSEMAAGAVVALKKLGQEILTAKYETALSSYVYNEPEVIQGNEADVDAKFAELAAAATEKRAYLDQCLAREQRKEELRLEFAEKANAFSMWVKDNVENLALAMFGFTLEEVEAYAAELKKTDDEIAATRAEKKAAYERVWADMQAMSFSDNPYTELTVEQLAAFDAQLTEGIQARRAKYDAELARQRANDQLCKKFAAVADPLSQWIIATKDTITRSKGKLREQLAFVEGKIAAAEKDGAARGEINALQAQMDAAGITNNRHTLLTAKDVEVLWEQYTQFLEKKKKMLLVEIENEELRGITPEQMAEIDAAFKQFDADKSNTIDARELKACLYSLGEEVLQSGIAKILAEYGDGKIIDYNGFKRFMIHLFGDTDSKEDVLSGWELISKGEPAVLVKHMEPVMEAADVEYIQQTAPKKGDGFDYRAWTEDVFSR